MLPVIQIGPLALQTSGLILMLGAWLGFSMSEMYAGYHRIKLDLVDRIGLISAIAFLVGGRLAFFSHYPDAFLSQPLSFFALSLTMFDPTGGVLICLAAVVVTVQIRKLNGWQVLDAFTPLILTFHSVIWLSDLATGDAYGVPTNLPWGIDLWGAIRHPVQAYFFVSNMVVVGLFMFRGGLYQQFQGLKDGSRFIISLFLTAMSWVAFSPFLAEGELLGGNVSVAQLVSLAVAGVCTYIFFKRNIDFIRDTRSDNG